MNETRYIIEYNKIICFVGEMAGDSETKCTQKNVLLFQQKFGWPNKVFRLNMGQWKFLLIQQNIFLGVNFASLIHIV